MNEPKAFSGVTNVGLKIMLGSRLAAEWDNATRTYREYAEDGTLSSQRPYTAEENAEADMVATELMQQDNSETISSRLLTVDLPAMQAIIEKTNANINSSPAADIKALARAVRRLTRKVENLLDGTD